MYKWRQQCVQSVKFGKFQFSCLLPHHNQESKFPFSCILYHLNMCTAHFILYAFILSETIGVSHKNYSTHGAYMLQFTCINRDKVWYTRQNGKNFYVIKMLEKIVTRQLIIHRRPTIRTNHVIQVTSTKCMCYYL